MLRKTAPLMSYVQVFLVSFCEQELDIFLYYLNTKSLHHAASPFLMFLCSHGLFNC